MDVRVADGTGRPVIQQRGQKAPPCTLVIFGAGGDLTKRLLMPAIYNLAKAKLLSDKFAIIAVDRTPKPIDAFRDYLAFYPHRVDGCFVDGERVQAQQGDFYGGWITANIVRPFKGGPGTIGW